MRLFVLSSSRLSRFQIRALEPVFESPEIQVVGACINERPAVPRWKRVRQELAKGRGAYTLVMVAHELIGRLREEPAVAAQEWFRARNVPTFGARRLYADETIGFIRGTRPDCIFRSGFGIIREPLLSLAPRGTISYHHGNIRAYRGTPVAFWELVHGETEVGATVQVLAAGLDCGRIASETCIGILPGDSWAALYRRVYAESAGLLCESLVRLSDESFEPEEIPESQLGALYTLPNLRQWLALQIAVLARRTALLFGSRRRGVGASR